MGKHYSEEFKNEVINAYKSGKYGGYRQVAKMYNIKESAVNNWIVKQRIQGNQVNDINHTRGRRKEENINYRERYEILKKYQAFIKAQREKK